jgi:hypothetical protein
VKTEHPCFNHRASSRTRVFKVLESLSISDSFFSHTLLIAGAAHVKSHKFVKSCKEYGAHIYLQKKWNSSSFLINILPIPKPINFVVSLSDRRQLSGFIKSIDDYLIAKIFFIDEGDSKSILDTLCNSAASPVLEDRLTIKSSYFIYGFDFDAQDPANPVAELYAYSLVPYDLKLFFE